jgi:hypothetical protein
MPDHRPPRPVPLRARGARLLAVALAVALAGALAGARVLGGCATAARADRRRSGCRRSRPG